MGINGEQVDEFESGKDVGSSEKTFSLQFGDINFHS
jgi:hypothetical protein